MLPLETILTYSLGGFASTASAVTLMREYVMPLVQVLSGVAGLVCVLFLTQAGYLYMSSQGHPDKIVHAKLILKRALLGLIIVLGAVTLATILSSSYGPESSQNQATLPNLESISEQQQTNGFIDMIIRSITGVLVQIISAVAAPFLGALDYFTSSTPLMGENPTVFTFWLAMVGIANILLILVIVLIGFHVMSASSLGFNELDPGQLLPRIALIFLFMNTSIFLIDGIIRLSNQLIVAVDHISGPTSVWQTLSGVVERTSGLGVAALLIMLAFVVCAIVLLVYYVMRLVTLYIGAVLAPLVSLLWLLPGFRDFAETAAKTYLTTIFVLFVHVVILQLAASLFAGMATADGEREATNVLMAMVTGIATVILLLKTQGLMMQFSYVSMGSRNLRKLGGQFISGVSFFSSRSSSGTRTTPQQMPTKSYKSAGPGISLSSPSLAGSAPPKTHSSAKPAPQSSKVQQMTSSQSTLPSPSAVSRTPQTKPPRTPPTLGSTKGKQK